MQLQENTVFDSHYTLIRLLGIGGFSEVWMAHDSYMELDVALKIYAPGKGMDSNSIDEFRHEIHGVFNLNHTNLLRPTYLGIYDKMPYLVMPYCSQGSINSKVGHMTEAEIWKFIRDVAAGLAFLHAKDIVHQDIKPDNILLDDNGNYVITDFGISVKARSTLSKSTVGYDVKGGTMPYMSPERFSKQPTPIKAGDIWSFGAMVFELLTGTLPFGEMGGGLLKGGAEVPEITVKISYDLKTTIERMLSLNPWDRPTAEQLVKIADAHINGTSAQPVVSRPTECYNHEISQQQEVYSPKKEIIRDKLKKAFTTIGICLLLIVLGCLTFYGVRYYSQQKTIARIEIETREKQERIEAERRAAEEKIEQDRIAAEQRAAEEKAEQERIAAEQRAERERKEAELRAKQAHRETLVALGYVDLGLPSETMWKAKNENGYYSYDVAVKKYGKHLLPSKQQFEELQNKCQWTWIGEGYRVTGPNGASIILPAEGLKTCSGEIRSVKQQGNYWTSTTSTGAPSDNESRATSFGFYSSFSNFYSSPYCLGYTVRLVSK